MDLLLKAERNDQSVIEDTRKLAEADLQILVRAKASLDSVSIGS